MTDTPTIHFVGFTETGQLARAIAAFGKPDFYHRRWDRRAIAEVMDGDVVIFAVDPAEVYPFTYDDSAHF